MDKPTHNSDQPCCFSCKNRYYEMGAGLSCMITRKPIQEWHVCEHHDYQRTGGGYFYG